MKFYIPVLVLALVAVLIVSGCSSKPVDTDVKPTNRVNVLTDIQVTVPDGWESEVDEGKAGILYFSPLEDENDMYSENFGVVIEYLPRPMTLDIYLSTSIENLKTYMGVDAGTPQSTTLAGLPAYKLEYDYEIEGLGQEGDALKVVQILTIKDMKAYVITLGGEKAKFSQYEATFQQMVDSFKIR